MALRVMTAPIYPLCWLLCLIPYLSTPALAQVTTTITSDGSLGTRVNQNGFIYTIDGGTIQGPNQFHSFDQFDVGTGHIANFTGPPTIENILSRVTGGSASLIDGTLQSEIPGADLYLLNPSGVIFGPSASLNVLGSFHVSTADAVRFEDGGTFNTVLSDDSLLSVSNPVGFGFLSENPVGIDFVNSRLQVREGETISIVGGDIGIRGSAFGTANGQIDLASVASPGEVALVGSTSAPASQIENVERLGTISLSNFSRVDINGGGRVLIRGGDLVLETGSQVNTFASPFGPDQGANISIHVTSLDLRDGSTINTSSGFVGSGGDVTIHAEKSLSLGDRQNVEALLSGIVTFSFGGGTGDIDIKTQNLSLVDGGIIGNLSLSGPAGRVEINVSDHVSIIGQTVPSGILSFSLGDPGTISLKASSLDLLDNGLIGAPSAQLPLLIPNNGMGSAGDVTVEVNTLRAENGAMISSLTSTMGAAGNVTVRATDSIRLSGPGTRIVANSAGREVGAGDAGNVVVEATDVILTERAEIASGTFGPGQGGSVTVKATGTVELDAVSVISANTFGQEANAGDAGNVLVEVRDVRLTGGAQINSFSRGPGQGGSVTVRAAEMVSFAGTSDEGNFPSGIIANARGAGMEAGNAGNVLVEAKDVMLTGDAEIASGTFGSGHGGSVTVMATGTVQLGTGGVISANAFGQDVDAGDAGNILVEARDVMLTEGSQINSFSLGPGQGGSVTVRASETVSFAGMSAEGNFSSGIFANARGASMEAGNAGNVLVEAKDVRLAEGAVISSLTLGPGQGGTIAIKATDIWVAGDGTRINAETEGTGDAGSIQLETDALMITDVAQISTGTRGLGRGGTLTVIARDSVDIIDRESGRFRSGLLSNSGEDVDKVAGDAGDIILMTPRLTVDGGRILTRTLGDGNAGAITIDVGRLEVLRGGQIFNGIGDRLGDGEIRGNRNGAGRGGNLTVRATESILIAGRDEQNFSSGLFSGAQIGTGRAGDLLVTTPHLEIRGGGAIAVTSREESRGDAGNLTLEVDALMLREGAAIGASTFGSGKGGTITVRGRGTVDTPVQMLTLTGPGSGLFTNAAGTGAGGNIEVIADSVSLADRAAISAQSPGTGKAGNIVIASRSLLLRENSAVTAEANQAGGGNITLESEVVTLTASNLTAEARGESPIGSDGGNIIIDGTLVTLNRSEVRTNALGGNGGNIDIRATEVFLASADSVLDASSRLGLSGTVEITSPVADLSGTVTPLSQTFSAASALLSQRCANRLRGVGRGRFVVASRDRFPIEPDAALPSPQRQVSAAATSAAAPRLHLFLSASGLRFAKLLLDCTR